MLAIKIFNDITASIIMFIYLVFHSVFTPHGYVGSVTQMHILS